MKLYIREGIRKSKEGYITPDSKYYAFDWDDNIVHMPTKILVKDENGETIEMSTRDFEIYKKQIGVTPFEYNGHIIVGPDENFLINFSEKKDSDFIPHSSEAEKGPAFDDFKEAIEGGSIFSIITARGNNPNTIRKAIRNYIVSGYGGIDKEKLLSNIKNYRTLASFSENMSPSDLLRYYLSLIKIYPVAYKNPTVNVPEAKVVALEDFISYAYKMSQRLGKRAFLKNLISNNFNPNRIEVGFSDDSRGNVEAIKKKVTSSPEVSFKTYYTGSGYKEEI